MDGRGPLPRAAGRRATAATWFITQCDDHDPRRARVEEGLGVRQVFSFETPASSATCSLHAKDTGGSFFEIDGRPTGRARGPDGPWEPAGRDWKKGQRLDTVDGIVAAELQADDPEALATRWSEIAPLPVARDAQGRPTVQLGERRPAFRPLRRRSPRGPRRP